MQLKFTKMHGIGNDYIYFNCMDSELENPGPLSVEMSRRHFSVGADGIVMICRSDIADAKMRMFNADGSEGKMCGNAIRCVGKYLYDNGIVNKTSLKIETLSGIKFLELNVENGEVVSCRVDMGIASVFPEALPVISDGPMISAPVMVLGREYRITAVSMGNPHAVIFCDQDISTLPLEKEGQYFENLSIFPERVNTEFVNVIDPSLLRMRVWERGSGETFACGTGACAVATAAVLNGISPKNTPITVRLIGGDLTVTVTDELRVFMEGKAEKVYDGIYTVRNA